jgi:DNA-binding TFAR19-related protein (PDSD5 family)
MRKMDDLEELRRKRVNELRRAKQLAIQQQFDQTAKLEQEVAQLEDFVKKYLTKEALLRYGNLKAGQPEKAVQLLVVLTQAIQSRQLGIIDDVILKKILIKFSEGKRDFNIKKV